MRPFAHALLVPIAMLAACGPGAKTVSNDQTVSNDTTSAEAPLGVTREAPPPATPAPYQPATVIQTQPGPSGSRFDLTRVAVTGDVLTVQFAASHPTSATVGLDLNDVSVVDDTTSQRYSVLQDGGGKWMASPRQGARVVAYMSKGQPEVYWFKFPAPPATSKTVSINLPGVGPFDGVPVTR
ncbi:hypothetical protein [Sphingomonas sp.]|uniref:hypothetical protein n=1 Tax=Sphingomonas sp. TaxID=28214 RepID=UPI003D6D31D7